MANEYLYGAYGHIGETVAQSAVQAGTTPVYIGTAPVNLVRGFADAGVINEPIKLQQHDRRAAQARLMRPTGAPLRSARS